MRLKVTSLIIASLVFCLCAAPVVALEPMLGDQVSGAVKLSPEEMAAIEPALAYYYAMDGSKPAIVRVIETAAAVGCRENCLSDVTSLMVQVMKTGTTCEVAGNEIIEALRAVESRCEKRGIKAKGPEISRAVRTRVESKYKKQNGMVF
jgi:hypothetical protein